MRFFLQVTLFFVLINSCFGKSDYYLIDEYFIKYPQEKKVLQDFEIAVKEKADPIKSQEKEIKIVMLYPGNQVSDYWRRSKDSFEARLKELNINYKLVDYFTRPFELTKQASILHDILDDSVDYLIFTLDTKKHSNFIERIINQKRPKVILQNITTPKKSWQRSQPFLYVGFDHLKGAKILADEYIERTNGTGEYAVLLGSRGYVSDMRGKEFIQYVSEKSRLKVKQLYYTNFDKKRAKIATLDLLQREKNLKFIYACSSDIAFGAIEALKETGNLGKIMINGWGGGSAEIQAIVDGELDLTVMRNNDDNGVAMAEAIKLDLQKEKKQPILYSGKFYLIEKGISLEKLQKLQEKAFRYSGVQ